MAADELPETPDLDDPRHARDRGYRDGFTGRPPVPGFPPGDVRAEAYGDGHRLGAIARQDPGEQQPADVGAILGEFVAGFTGGAVFTGTLEEFRAWISSAAAVDEAEMAMRGEHPVSVVHGDMETDDDAKLIGTLLPRCAEVAAQQAGATIAGTRGGNDYTTYRFAGAGAAKAAADFAGYARYMALMTGRRWWNVTETPSPVFPGWGPPG